MRDFAVPANNSRHGSEHSDSSGARASALSDQESRCVQVPNGRTASASHAQHLEAQQDRADGRARPEGRGSPQDMAVHGDAREASGACGRGGRGHVLPGPLQDRVPATGTEVEPGQREAQQPGELCDQRAEADGEPQHERPPDTTRCHHACLCHDASGRHRPRGLRKTCGLQLCRDPGASRFLRPMGATDSQGERVRPSSSTAGGVVGEGESVDQEEILRLLPEGEDDDHCGQGSYQGGHEDSPKQPQDRHIIGEFQHGGDDAQHDGGGAGTQGRDGRDSSRPRDPTSQGSVAELKDGQQLPDGGAGPHVSPAGMIEGVPHPTDGLGQDPVVAGVMKDLSLQSARHLETQAEALVPQLFQGLAARGKAVLMEVACEPDSILTSCVRTATGREDSAMRCSLFNSCDLGTHAGIRLILEHIDREEPSHVWLSPPCGPYSPIQNCNQRSPQQLEALQNKRKEARKLYQGCCIIFRYCVQRGIHVTWEMSERCLAWRLPALNELKQHYQLWEAVTKGCAVNLRESPKGKFLKKGWKLLTTHRRLAQHMNLPCRCPPTYLHAVCEGRVTRQSGLYTREFGNRVAKLLLQELDRPQVQQECDGVTCLPEAFGEGSRCVCSEVKQPNLPAADCAFCMLGSKRGISSKGRVEASGSGKETQAPQVSRRPVASGSDPKTQVQDKMEELLSMRTRNTKPSFSELENVMKQLQELYGKTSTQTLQARWSFGIRKQGEEVNMQQDTFQYPHLCRWLNELAKQHMPEKADWNNIEVYLNCPPPIHKKGRGYQDGKIVRVWCRSLHRR